MPRFCLKLGMLLALSGCTNHEPGPASLSISPTGPVTSDDLELSIKTPAPDADGDEVTYTVQWSRDGEPVTDLDNQWTVPATQTSKGEEWAALVTANDGELDGPTAVQSVVVLNSVPTVSVSISPDSPDNTKDLEAIVVAEDADGDEVSIQYEWSVDGEFTYFTESSVASEHLASGQVWEVRVTPSDSEVAGETVSVSTSITNGAPVIQQLDIVPNPARVRDTLSVVVDTEDSDGHSVTYSYEWSVNGVSVGVTTETFEGGFVKGDEVGVVVTPNDGFTDGATAEATVGVENTPPSIASVSLSESRISETSEVECVVGDWDDPDGDTQTALLAWFVDGVEVSTSSILRGDLFNRDNEVYCSVTPFDGEDNGPTLTSESLIVDNSTPVVNSVSLSTLSPTAASGISAIVDAEDADGDSLTYAYYWTVGGQALMLPPETDTLTSDDFDSGDSISVIVSACDSEGCGVGIQSPDVAVAVNSKPRVKSITLDPVGQAFTNDVITATVTTADADGDAVAVSYQWFVNGVAVGQSTATLNGATYFSKGDEVFVEVTPTDGSDDGTTKTSDVVEIINSLPSAPSVSIIPARAVAGDHNLECVIDVESVDADGDALSYNYEWLVDGVDALISRSVVSKTLLSAGESWTCLVTPNDGSQDGSAGSAVREIASWPDNWVTIFHEDFSDGLAQSFEKTDSGCGGQSGEISDGIPVWQFTSDWNSLRLEIPESSEPGLAFETRFRFFNGSGSSAVRWRSNVASWDSNDDAGFTLNAQLSASEQTFGEDEICINYCDSGQALDLVPEQWVEFRVEEWNGDFEVFIDDLLVAAGPLTDLPDIGDFLEFSGGGSCGAPMLEIDHVTIQTATTLSGNVPPGAPGISLVPFEPQPNSADLNCMIDEISFDADGDVADYIFDWTVNGSGFDQVTSSYWDDDTVPSSAVTWGDLWTCTVTPNDGKQSGTSVSESVVVVPSDCRSPKNVDGEGSIARVEYRAEHSLNSGDFTVEAWVRPTAALDSEDRRIVGVHDSTYAQWSLGYDATQGGVGAVFSDGVSQIKVYSSNKLQTDAWQHVAVTRAVDTFTVWIDGRSVASTNNSAVLASLSSDLFIGNNRDSTNGWMGYLDEVRISQTARYTSSFLPQRSFEPDGNTIGLWSLDSNGSTVYDASELIAHGQLTEGVWSTESTCDVTQASVAAGSGHTCGLDDEGNSWCIGDNRYGQSDSPAGTFTQIAAGRHESCAIRSDFSVTCWGDSETLQGAPSSAREVSLGWFHGCSEATNHALSCWGVQDGGVFDFGQVSDAPVVDVVSVAAGAYFSCAVREDGQLVCWGRDQYGILSPPTGTFKSVSAGVHHGCALDADDAIQCWGVQDGSDDDFGQVSDAPLGSFVTIRSGDFHSCALDRFGTTHCWGRDDLGQATPPSTIFTDISAGAFHSCGVDSLGQLECWGSDSDGQVSGGDLDTGMGGGGTIPEGECASAGFDGVDDFADLGANNQFPGLGTSDFSMEVWLRLDQVGQPMTVLLYGDDSALFENEHIWIRVLSSGAIEATVRGEAGGSNQSVVTSTRLLAANEWVHVHLQRDVDTALRLYVDGVLEDSVSDIAGPVSFSSARSVLVGAAYDYETMSRSEFFHGALRELRFWGRTLPEEEIESKRYQVLDPSVESGLNGYWTLEEGAGGLVMDSVSGAYGQLYDDYSLSGNWAQGAEECLPEVPVSDSGLFLFDSGDSGIADSGLDTALDTDTDLPTSCVQVTASVDGVTVYDAGFDFTSFQTLTYPGWVAYPLVYFANASFSSMNATADNLFVRDLTGTTLVSDDFSDPAAWEVARGIFNCSTTNVSGGQANALSDRATFRGVSQMANVDSGASISFDVQFDSAVEWFTMGFNGQGADTNCGTCDADEEALCGAVSWFQFSIDRENGQVLAWIDNASNVISMSPLGALPQDGVVADIKVSLEPRAVCSSGVDTGALSFDTGN